MPAEIVSIKIRLNSYNSKKVTIFTIDKQKNVD